MAIILTWEEFKGLVGQSNAENWCGTGGANFDLHEEPAAQEVLDTTALAKPATPAAAPKWAKGAVSSLIAANRMPFVSGVKYEHLAAAKAAREQVTASLQQYRASAAEPKSTVTAMDDMVRW